jgi:superfamily II DNA or RNA helicase
MDLLDQLRDHFTSQDLARGAKYFGAGMVDHLVDQGDAVHAEVRNEQGMFYEVFIGFDGDTPSEIECSCPRFEDGYACKHIWASVLQLSLNRGASETNSHSVRRSAKKKKKKKAVRRSKVKGQAKTKSPEWLLSLNQVVRESSFSDKNSQYTPPVGGGREQRIWYTITLNQNLTKSSPQIDFEQQVRRRDGQWGALKPLSITERGLEISNRVHRDAIDTIDHWRRALKDETLDWRYRSHGVSQMTDWTIPALAFDAVLPKLFATGSVRWRLDASTPPGDAFQVRWDERVWLLDIEVVTDEEASEWVFRAQLTCGGESCGLDDTVFVFTDGLVLFSNRMAKFEPNGNLEWLPVLRSTGTLRVPFKDRDRFVREFGDSDVIAGLALPEDLLPPPVAVQPTARIRLKTVNDYGKSRVHGDIDFLYGDLPVRARAKAQLIRPDDSETCYRRNKAAEQTWLKALPADLRPYAGREWSEGRPDVDCLPARMIPIVGELLEAGWDVEIEERKVRQGGVVRVSVKSDVDWFDLEGEIDFDETAAELPDILEAAKLGQQFVKLRDGSLGMLPQEWLDQNEDLIALGELGDGKVRFRQSQAMLLDSLLAAQPDSQSDKTFRAFCRKLRSFDGIKPKAATRGFKGKLREYQRDGLAWLNFLREFGLGGCLADDMGLGKTVQVLALLESRRTRRLKADEERLPSLVVVPKSLVFNWIEEANRFAPKLRVGNYTGTERKSLLNSLDEYDLLVTTYGSMRIDIVELKEIAFDYVILDESQAIKNANAQAAKAVRLLNGCNRLAMTGTPIENHLGELWSLFEFLNPGMLGRSTAFKRLAKRPRLATKTDAVDGEEATVKGGDREQVASACVEMLAQAIRPYMLRRTKQEVLTELPDKTEQTLFCELSSKQRKTYDKIRNFYRVSLMKSVKKKGLKRSKIHVLEALLRLRQAACHPGLIDADYAKSPSAKLDMLDTQLEEIAREGRKVLVFSQFTSLLGLVRDRLDKQGTVYEYLDGKTSDRQARVDRFQADPECSVFLISLKAGGSGLNLTAAEYVFILDPWWNPAVEAQAIDRAHRIGQKNQVFAYRLIARGTVEERILELQKSKRDLADSIISADSSLISDLSSEDLQLLLS